jgi:hypothetical protein
MLLLLALLATLLVGVVIGLAWRGTVVLGDHRALDRLASRLLTELRMEAHTQATLQAMRRAGRDSSRAGPDVEVRHDGSA